MKNLRMLFLVIIMAMSSSLFGWGMKDTMWRMRGYVFPHPTKSEFAYGYKHIGKKQIIEQLLGQFNNHMNCYTPALKKLFFVSMYNATKNPWWM